MPWSSQGGGGGGGGGGPWGGGGGGGRGPNPWGRPSGGGGPQPPNIEEILKRGQDRLRRVMPGGFGSGKGLAILAALFVAAWAVFGGMYRVQPDEQGVELLFGKWVNTTTSGLHFWVPPPFGSVLKPKVTRINTMDIGFRGAADPRGGRSRTVPEEALMLTGDENILDIQYTVFWNISDAGKFLFNIASPEATVKAAAESAMREVVGNMQAQFALAEGRTQIESSASKLLQQILDSYGAGVQITQLQLRGVEPPQQVIDAFRDVQRAQADRERARNEAESYRNDIVPRARGEAQRLIQEAEGYRQQVVAQAQGEASRFVSVYTAYKLAEDVTKQRLYLETMEQILRSANKIVIDQALSGGQGVVPFLPLNELGRGAQPQPSRPATPPAGQPPQQGAR